MPGEREREEVSEGVRGRAVRAKVLFTLRMHLHCILACLVSFYSASRGGSFGVYPVWIRPLTSEVRTL